MVSISSVVYCFAATTTATMVTMDCMLLLLLLLPARDPGECGGMVESRCNAVPAVELLIRQTLLRREDGLR